MTMIRYGEFEPALREKFESICAAKKIDHRSFQVMAIINLGELHNGFGRVYVRRSGLVRDYHAGTWLAEFEADVAEQFGQERSDSQIVKTDNLLGVHEHGSCAQPKAPTPGGTQLDSARPSALRNSIAGAPI